MGGRGFETPLLRKAIKLTLLEPDNQAYRQLTDRLLEIYRQACRVQCGRRLNQARPCCC